MDGWVSGGTDGVCAHVDTVLWVGKGLIDYCTKYYTEGVFWGRRKCHHMGREIRRGGEGLHHTYVVAI